MYFVYYWKYFLSLGRYVPYCLGYWSHPGLCVGGTFPCPFPTRSHQSSYAHVASHVVPDPVRKPQSAYIYIYTYIEMCMFISLHLYMYVYIYNHTWGSGAVRRLYCRPHADRAIDVNLVFWAWRHVKWISLLLHVEPHGFILVSFLLGGDMHEHQAEWYKRLATMQLCVTMLSHCSRWMG